MSKKVLQPELRFPEFEGGWKVPSFKDIYEFGKTNSFSRAQLTNEEGSVKNIHYGDIHTKLGSHLDLNKQTLPSVINFNKNEADLFLKEGDVVLADASEDYEDIGKAVEAIDLKKEKVVAGLHTIWGKNKAKDLTPGFAGHLLKTKSFRKQIKKVAQGIKVLGLPKKYLKNLNLYIPSKEEQEKIASFLSLVDTYIENLEKQKVKLEEYKKGVIQKIFSQEIRFKDKNGEEFPDWKKEKLGDLLTERNNRDFKSKAYPLMAFVAGEGVSPKGTRYNREFLVSDKDKKKYKQTEYGDFIYSSNNLDTGSIGLNYYGSASISPVYSIFKIGKSCSPEFINYFLTCKNFVHKMIRYRQGVVYGQWKIREADFLKMEEKFPSLEEQEKIANFLFSLSNSIKISDGLMVKVKSWRKGLLQKMFV